MTYRVVELEELKNLEERILKGSTYLDVGETFFLDFYTLYYFRRAFDTLEKDPLTLIPQDSIEEQFNELECRGELTSVEWERTRQGKW